DRLRPTAVARSTADATKRLRTLSSIPVTESRVPSAGCFGTAAERQKYQRLQLIGRCQGSLCRMADIGRQGVVNQSVLQFFLEFLELRQRAVQQRNGLSVIAV